MRKSLFCLHSDELAHNFAFFSDFKTETHGIACGYGFTASRSTKCLYKLDQYGHIEGCRSLQHLQNCGMYRGSYTSTNVLLNLLKELRKRDNMRGWSSILSLFLNKFNKFNIT